MPTPTRPSRPRRARPDRARRFRHAGADRRRRRLAGPFGRARSSPRSASTRARPRWESASPDRDRLVGNMGTLFKALVSSIPTGPNPQDWRADPIIATPFPPMPPPWRRSPGAPRGNLRPPLRARGSGAVPRPTYRRRLGGGDGGTPPSRCGSHAVDGAVVAYAKLGPPSLPFTPEAGAIELRQFYVLAPFHGGGIAQDLMDWAIAEAGRRGIGTLYLCVFTDNRRARRFYTRYGFTAVRRMHEGRQPPRTRTSSCSNL
ncbi:N-acetyltransferase family protein [Sphingomonas sp. MMS24-JH45]